MSWKPCRSSGITFDKHKAKADKYKNLISEMFEDKGVQEGFNGIRDNILYIHSTYLDMEREFIPDSIWNDFEDKRNAYELWLKGNKEPKIIKKANYYKHVILGGWLNTKLT